MIVEMISTPTTENLIPSWIGRRGVGIQAEAPDEVTVTFENNSKFTVPKAWLKQIS